MQTPFLLELDNIGNRYQLYYKHAWHDKTLVAEFDKTNIDKVIHVSHKNKFMIIAKTIEYGAMTCYTLERFGPYVMVELCTSCFPTIGNTVNRGVNGMLHAGPKLTAFFDIVIKSIDEKNNSTTLITSTNENSS